MSIQFVLGGNGTSLNRGCQAIETATLGILRRAIPTPRFVIAPMGVDNEETPTDADCIRVKRGVWGAKRFSPAWFAKNTMLRISPRSASRRLFKFDVLDKFLPEACGLLQLGGDNFSLDYGGAEPFFALNDYVLRRGCPVVLWGASVGPFSAEPCYETHAVRELRRAHLILAREQMTADYLTGLGLGAITERVADPAFVLEPFEPAPGVVDANLLTEAIGFNISPLFERYTGRTGNWVNRVCDVVERIVRDTGRPVVLISHVIVPDESDHALLTSVMSELIDRGLPKLPVLPAALTASEIKWCIARLYAFVGARTHATIAALSSEVPTLSLAYSMKARGINRDLLGSEEYVCPATEFGPEAIVSRLQRLLENAPAVREQLQSALPTTRALAEGAGALVVSALGLNQ